MCERAVRLYRDRADKTAGVVDCLSFVVMRRHGAGGALMTDHHFEQAGFEALLRPTVPDGLLRSAHTDGCW